MKGFEKCYVLQLFLGAFPPTWVLYISQEMTLCIPLFYFFFYWENDFNRVINVYVDKRYY